MIKHFAFVLTVCAAVTVNHLDAQKPSKPKSVGMVALLAAPEKYDGKVIQTWGYLHIGRMPEDDSLWLREEDGKFALYKNSFALEFSPDQREQFQCVNHTYILLVGTLKSEGPDKSGMNSGRITKITHLIGWLPYRPSPCEAK